MDTSTTPRSLTVGVEGATEQAALPVLFALSTGTTMTGAGITLWSCGSDAKTLGFVRTLAQHDRNVALVVDADCRFRPSLSPAVEAVRGLGAGRVHWLGAPREFEELFTDRQWAACANAVFRRRDGRDWTVDDVARYRETGKFSAQWVEEVRTRSCRRTLGKPELGHALAASLSHTTDVPVALREVFDDLLALTSRSSIYSLAA